MAETEAPESDTLTLGEFVKQHCIDAVHELVAWNDVLGHRDEIHRTHAAIEAHEEMFAHTMLPVDRQLEIISAASDDEPRRHPTPLAEELPDGVDNFASEARRSVLDLLRVLVVAETGASR